MPRMLSDLELTHLTIPRLQSLLKAWRTRAHSVASCDCCGESYKNLYGPDHPRAIAGTERFEYVERIKQQLKELQSNNHDK